MAQIIEGKFEHTVEEEAMVPMEEWDGSCWRALFEGFFVANFGEEKAWDMLAEFIRKTLMGLEEPLKGESHD